MKKLSIFAFSIISFLCIANFSGCDLLGSLTDSSSNTSSGSEPTSIELITDANLTKDAEDDNNYNLTLIAGNSYKINYSIGDYTGNEYYVTIELISDDYKEYITVNEDGLLTAKDVDEPKYAAVKVALKKKNKTASVDYKYIFVKIETVDNNTDVAITFAKGDMSYDKRASYYNWFFNLAYGENFTIKPIISGIEDFYITYSIDDEYSEYVQVKNTGVVTAIKNTSESKSIFIKLNVHNSKDKIVKEMTIPCHYNGTKQSDNVDYKDSFITLNANTQVSIIETGNYYNYTLGVGFADINYLFPTVTISNFTKGYTLNFDRSSDYSNVSFEQIDGKIYVKVTSANVNSIKSFYITATDAEHNIIDKILCNISITGIGKGNFNVFCYEKQESYTEDKTINLYKNQYIDLSPQFSCEGLIYKTTDNSIALKNNFSYQVFDGNAITTEIIPPIQGKYYIKIYADKVGVSKMALSYTHTDNAEAVYNYSITITFNVIDKVIDEIYVINPEYITIEDSTAYVNGKIVAKYNDGSILSLNGLSIGQEILDTAEANIKQVTFSYNGKTCTYSVDLTKTNAKTKLDTTYYDYWNSAIKTTPLSGNVKVLVIPIWFTNSSTFISESLTDYAGLNQKQQVLQDLNTILFDDGFNTGWKSLRQFYLEESYGKLSLSGTVSDWINVDNPSTAYQHGSTSSTPLVDQVVAQYFNTSADTPSNYDSNNDNVIDALMIYYGAPYLSSPTNASQYSEQSRGYVSRTSKTISGTSYKYSNYSFINFADMYNIRASANSINQLQTCADLSHFSTYLSSETSIHEFGHMLGLYDLYDTVIDSKIFPAGAFTMQDYDVCGHDPYSVMSLGWANPYIFDATALSETSYEITIKDFQSSGDVILLTPSWNSDNSPFDEYILIDLYSPTGLNEYHSQRYSTIFDSSNVGIRIWHINASLDSETKKHIYNNDSSESASDNDTKHLVHYIRNDVNSEYGINAQRMSSDTLFYKGDTFNIAKYNSQFKENGTLDGGQSLNWEVSIVDITIDANGNASATIRLTKII